MVNEISISNYKSILHQKFALGRVNVFIGGNGCGKTNILEAIGMAAAAHDDALDADSLRKRGVRVAKPSLTFHSSRVHAAGREIEIAWRERHSWKKARLICDRPDDDSVSWKDVSWRDPEYVDKLNNLIRFIGDGSIEGQYPFPDESKNAVLNAAFRGSRNFRDYLIYDINTVALRGLSGESRKEPPGIFGERLGLLLSTLTGEQVREIQSCNRISWMDGMAIFDNPATSLQKQEQNISVPCFTDRLMQERKNLLSAENAASGTLHALFYLALFASKRTPAFFAVDNIETLLAPKTCRELMQTVVQLAAKQNKQALIATHHPAILDGLDLADPEQKIFWVKRADDGQTVVEELKDKTRIEI